MFHSKLYEERKMKEKKKSNLQTNKQNSLSVAVDDGRGSLYWEQWPNKAKYQTVNNLPVNCLLMKNTEMQKQQLSLSAWLPSLCLPLLSLSLYRCVCVCPHRSLSLSSFFTFSLLLSSSSSSSLLVSSQ